MTVHDLGDPRRLVVVSATATEAAHMPAGIETVICGIGKVDAAAVTTAAVLRAAERTGAHSPEDITVVNTGTAGALHDGHSGLYTPSAVTNHDISSEALRALGHPLVDRIELPGGDGSVLATGDVFVSDPAVRSRLSERADLVDMEGFAIARACGLLGTRAVLVKYVSDDADASAMDWPALVDRCARELGRWVDEHIGHDRSGAPSTG
ncbi:MAG: nucleosidase [Tomitella sp.]|nr:nucleosidase [Tomitella sp.]